MPTEKVTLSPQLNGSDNMTRMAANVYCSSGMVKCTSCSGKLTADELIENDGTCFNCKPKPVDVEGILKDAMEQRKEDV